MVPQRGGHARFQLQVGWGPPCVKAQTWTATAWPAPWSAFVLGAGRAACWANGILVLVIVLQVVLRYAFNSGMVMPGGAGVASVRRGHPLRAQLLRDPRLPCAHGPFLGPFQPPHQRDNRGPGHRLLLLASLCGGGPAARHGVFPALLGAERTLRRAPWACPSAGSSRLPFPSALLMLGLAGLARLLRSVQIYHQERRPWS